MRVVRSAVASLREAIANTRRAAPEDRPSKHCSGVAGDQVISGMIKSATMFATLIIGLIAGPAVSL
jgi:hypothetical protein